MKTLNNMFNIGVIILFAALTIFIMIYIGDALTSLVSQVINPLTDALKSVR